MTAERDSLLVRRMAAVIKVEVADAPAANDYAINAALQVLAMPEFESLRQCLKLVNELQGWMTRLLVADSVAEWVEVS